MRDRREGEDDKVAFPELFFDLVFVFSLIQLSHTLAGHYTLLGALEALLMILAVWWVWIFTTWVTNWLDPDRMPVRAMLFALMFGALLLSTAINDAFGDKALLFALSYVAMQVGRSLFTVYALHGHSPDNARDFLRITCWLVVSGVFWIAGALIGGEAQLFIWIAALTIEYVSPAVGFRVPGLGRSEFDDWDVLGAHMAERCALFVLICLGETILVTGRTLAEMEVTPLVFVLALSSFGSTVTMWWIYFRFGQERAAAQIESDESPGEVARTIFTYAHIPVVAGIILCAVADEFVLAHPYGAIDVKTASAIIGGPIVFLAGNIWIKSSVAPRLSVSHLGGIGLYILAAPLAFVVEPHVLLIISFVILVIVAVWEYLTLKAVR
ncbi:low temperature requirement protein A [Rhizobium sp. PP-F2F-G48]|uniref:low temperature requirement protein A n=1 Tax=Rhizobium sp. PP-F2F-G48 TaxID=2135651 RepID=UPI0010526AC2|nr:low temperature requirement protein A [Rhizobium sp. PP-F2F-G48]